MSSFKIAPTVQADVPALQTVLDLTELFPSALLPELLAQSRDGGERAIWVTCHHGGSAIGFCYAVPEPMTEGTWNLRALALHPDFQREGGGKAVVRDLESQLTAAAQRVLIVDTSGAPTFQAARQFYLQAGFIEEARIRDFWAAGDDKVTYWKKL